MKKIAILGMVGMIMMAGSIVRGDKATVNVSILSPAVHTDGNYYIKSNGAVSGTHSCTNSDYTPSDISMTGAGAGSASFGPNGTWSGSGASHSVAVNDTKVIVTYENKVNLNEKNVSGEQVLTVVDVVGSFTGTAAFPFRRGRIWSINAVKGFPQALSFGNITLTFSAPQLLNPNPNPLSIQNGGNQFSFDLQVNSLKLKGLLNSTVTLSCPFGPQGFKFAFGGVGTFSLAGKGAIIPPVVIK